MRRTALHALIHRQSPDYLQVDFLRAIAPEYFPTVGEKSMMGLRITPQRDRLIRSCLFIEGKQPGDPIKAANAIIQVVEAENPPLRLVLGKYAYSKFRQKIESLTQELNAWEEVAANTDA
jgi:hypothetical protein